MAWHGSTYHLSLGFSVILITLLVYESEACNCQDCKYMSDGEWVLDADRNDECPTGTGCFYQNGNNYICFCDPGNISYVPCDASPSVTPGLNASASVTPGLTPKEETCNKAWLEKHQGVRLLDEKRIIGGAIVTKWKTWPWTASLNMRKTKGSYGCGGVLVSCQHIVTAKHCLYDSSTKKIIQPKDVTISLGSIIYIGGIKFKGKIIYYKNTGMANPSLGNNIPEDDIAVIKMNATISIDSGIIPILLPTDNVKTIENNDPKDRSKNFWVTGWGGTPAETNQLKETNMLKLRPGNVCKQKIPFFNPAKVICYERFVGDALCPVDSGDPGMIKETKDGKWNLHAVYSFRRGKCTDAGLGGMANVFFYAGDIQKILGGTLPSGWVAKE